MKKLISMIAMMVWAGAAMADIAITSVTAQQRYPWNGLVDIVVTIEGDTNEITQTECSFTATNCATQAAVSVANISQVGDDSFSANVGTRYYLWDATTDVGAVKIDDLELIVNATLGVQLWENGPYWARCNVGARNPDEYGYYFWWGDTVGYMRVGGSLTSDGNYSDVTWMSSAGTLMSESPFTSSTCPTIISRSNAALLSLGYIDSTGNLVAAHDAATVFLGSSWHMPADTDFSDLISNCTTTWTTRDGVCGRLVSGKGNYAAKSIFLPAAGYGDGSKLYCLDSNGYYWSSTPNSSIYASFTAWNLDFGIIEFSRGTYNNRCHGRSVRPLREVSGSSQVSSASLHLAVDCRKYVGITFEANGGNCTVANTNILADAVLGELPIPTRDDYMFLGWYTSLEDGDKVTDTTEIKVDTVLYAKWKLAFYIMDVTARQRYPWNGIVDIAVTIHGDTNDMMLTECAFVATYGASQTDIPITEISQVGSDSFLENCCRRYYQWHAFTGHEPVNLDDVALTVMVKEKGVQLWAGGPYWSECNVGATKSEDRGYYFWWGDTVGYEFNGSEWISSRDRSSLVFSSANCPTYGKDNSSLQSLGYIDATGNLNATHDAATVHLGKPWRMPTATEVSALISNCTTTWTTHNGVYGRLITGKGDYSTRKIFLPASGSGDRSSLFSTGSSIFVWSSTPDSDYLHLAHSLCSSSDSFTLGTCLRECGLPVRPLRDAAEILTTQPSMTTHLNLNSCPWARTCSVEGETIVYDSNWYNNASMITITDNGTKIGSGTKGTLLWVASACGSHVLQLVASSADGSQVGSETAEFVLEHATVTRIARTPTYDEPGCSAGSYCSRCGAVVSGMVVPTYLIIPDANGGEGAMTNLLFVTGVDLTLDKNTYTRTGYHFSGWSTEIDGPVVYGDQDTITNITCSGGYFYLYANWTGNSYTVTYDVNGGVCTEASKPVVYAAEYGELATPSRTGYTFTGWYTAADGGTHVSAETQVGTAADHTLYAHWTANTYKMTYDANGGSCTVSGQDVIYDSASGELAVPTREGYTFTGWFTAAKGGAQVTSDTVVSSVADFTLYAHWTANDYTVNFDANGGVCSEATKTVAYDSAYGKLPMPTRRFAAAFLGWYTEPEGGTQVTATTMVSTASDHTLYAHWDMLPSETHSDATYYYTYLTDSTARLEGTGDDPETIVIPAEMNGRRVTEVAADAFAASAKAMALEITEPLMPVTNYVGVTVAERLTSIMIGEGTTELPDGFFAGCTGLLHVSLPDSIQAIDGDALDGSPDFEWEIVDGYKYCSKWLFGYTEEAIESLTHTDTLKGVANGALKGCTAIHYFTCEAGSELKHIGSRAFYGCVKLSSVTLPEGVTDIGDEAFYGCTVMTNFIIPGTVKTVGDAAFKNCTSLTKALIGYGVESIGEEAFYSDWRIGEVDIPSTVTNIGTEAFGGDSSIIRVGMRGDICQGVRFVFSNYDHIREMTIKEGEGVIPRGFFYGCTELKDIRYLGDCPEIEGEGDLLYEYADTNSQIPVSYVTQGSTGWDGVEGSEALPQAWPLVGAYRRSITFWDLPTYLCQFDANGGTLGVQDTYQYSEKNVVLPPEPVQSGYKFAGWWTQPIGGLQVTSDTIFIEGVYAYLYAHWIKGHWVFLDPNGGEVVNDFITYVEESTYGVLPTPVRSGYAFGGWLYNGQVIEPETEINEKADHTLVAQWTANLYSVRYNPNGGTGDEETQNYVYGVEQALRKNTYERAGYTFSGWATNETGEVVYQDCEVVSNLTAVADGFVDLYAVWEKGAIVDPTNVSFTFGGDEDWMKCYEGVVVTNAGEELRYDTIWKSGSISDNQSSVIKATVNGPGKIAFWWKVSCEQWRTWKLDYLEFAVDGVAREPWVNGETEWQYMEFEVEEAGEHVLTWTYAKDEEGTDGEDCGRICAVVWTHRLETLADYLNSTNLVFTTSGNANWSGDSVTNHDGVASLKSGSISDGEKSVLETSVTGAGKVSFWWKVSSEAFRNYQVDYVSFSVDGIVQIWMGGEVDWTNACVAVEGTGTHTLKWVYQKDSEESTSDGDDCAWLDEVAWEPTAIVLPVIDPEAGSVEIEEETPDRAAEKATVSVPDGAQALIDAKTITTETYQGYFTKTAVLKEGTTGTYVVTAKIADEVKTDAAESAATQVLATAGSTEMTVAVKPGLCYGFTSAASLGELGTVETEMQEGTSLKITKGADHKFVKIVISAQPVIR